MYLYLPFDSVDMMMKRKETLMKNILAILTCQLLWRVDDCFSTGVCFEDSLLFFFFEAIR